MSRSNPEEDIKLKNPALRFYEFSGSEGNFTYYDQKEKKKIPVPLPFTFLPLRRCVTVKGYNDDTKTSYWANEVKDITTDQLIVQSVTNVNGNKKISTEGKGLYKDLKKPVIDALGLSYVESLYIAVKNGNKLELCNLQIKGSALGPWFEFCEGNKVFEVAVKVASSVDKKKGAVKYKEPVYTAITKISKEMNDQAIELDLQIKEYLEGYFAKNKEKAATAEVDAEPVKEPVKTTKAPDTKGKSEAPFVKGTPKGAQHSDDFEDSTDIIVGDEDAPDEF